MMEGSSRGRVVNACCCTSIKGDLLFSSSQTSLEVSLDLNSAQLLESSLLILKGLSSSISYFLKKELMSFFLNYSQGLSFSVLTLYSYFFRLQAFCILKLSAFSVFRLSVFYILMGSFSYLLLSCFCFIMSISIFFFSFISSSLILRVGQGLSLMCGNGVIYFSMSSLFLSFLEVSGEMKRCSLMSFLSMETSLLQLGREAVEGDNGTTLGLRLSATGFQPSLRSTFLLPFAALSSLFFIEKGLLTLGCSLSFYLWVFLLGDSMGMCLMMSLILLMRVLSWTNPCWQCLTICSQFFVIFSRLLRNQSMTFISRTQILDSSLARSFSLIFMESSQRHLNYFWTSFLYSLFLRRLQVERVLLLQRQGQPIWLMMFLQMTSIELVSSVFIRVKQLQMVSCSSLHLGLMLLSIVYFLTRPAMSSSVRQIVVPMWLWYFRMHCSQPAAYFHTQQSDAQKVVIRSPCSHLFIVQQVVQIFQLYLNLLGFHSNSSCFSGRVLLIQVESNKVRKCKYWV